MGQKELIVSFTHTNYNVKTGGTEKYVLELSKMLKNGGYCHLNFFPFPKKKSFTGKDIVGVNYNDKFEGIIRSSDMAEMIRYILKRDHLLLNCFHIQHLKRHNISDVFSTIKSFQAEVYIFVHDFFLICKSEHFINSIGKFCGDGIPTKEKCRNCAYYSDGVIHNKTMYKYLESIEDRIGGIICPSDYVKNVLLLDIPSLSEKVILRPHLSFSGERKLDNNIENIKIAFLGRKRKHKGYEKWQEVLASLNDAEKKVYEFYYLGMDVEEEEGINNVFVSTTTQGNDAMKNAIGQNNISCAFLWPQCPETYSFVYYELLMSGVYIITNSESGNIKNEVENKENGIVFDTLEECIQWLGKPENVKDKINEYRRNHTVPEKYVTNSDISMMISNRSEDLIFDVRPKRKVLPITSVMYWMKYREFKL